MHGLAAPSSTLTASLITGITIFLLSLDFPAAFASQDTFPYCNHTFSCGPLTNIHYPFSGGLRPDYCGHPGFQLTCLDNTTTQITINSLVYRVIQLNQLTQSLLLSREDLFNTTCTNLLIDTNFNNTLFSFGSNSEIITLFYGCNESVFPETSKPANMFTCEIDGKKDDYYSIGSVSSPKDPILSVFKCSASIQVPVLIDLVDDLEKNRSFLSDVLKTGFNVSFRNPFSEDCVKCYHSGAQCGFDLTLGRSFCICDDDLPCLGGKSKSVGLGVGLISSAFAALIIIVGCYYCFRTKLGIWSDHKEENHVEAFITNYHSLMPQRYSYSDIKKMTNSFTHKLGQGGFGSVFRGNLSDGRPVAVKLLLKSTGDGEEFINEVASISRTSHINIVTLLGFCYQKTKRALVYEYMPNGSLDKFICHQGDEMICHLEQKKMFEIAIGIARGLEYLHRGCNTRIVHFDIKPQNILLDNDMCPKISDFGLAKLCKGKESIVSMLGARGTAGYIAPEVFMRGCGGVSYKSDVYSYGMMILEMFASKDTDHNEGTNTNSETYFPDYIYKYLEREDNTENILLDEKEETMRRVIKVGLWCIQTNPTNRPSMTKVIEMLEGSIEFLHVPPKPLLFSSNNRTEFSSSSTYLQSQLDEENILPLPEAGSGSN